MLAICLRFSHILTRLWGLSANIDILLLQVSPLVSLPPTLLNFLCHAALGCGVPLPQLLITFMSVLLGGCPATPICCNEAIARCRLTFILITLLFSQEIGWWKPSEKNLTPLHPHLLHHFGKKYFLHDSCTYLSWRHFDSRLYLINLCLPVCLCQYCIQILHI